MLFIITKNRLATDLQRATSLEHHASCRRVALENFYFEGKYIALQFNGTHFSLSDNSNLQEIYNRAAHPLIIGYNPQRYKVLKALIENSGWRLTKAEIMDNADFDLETFETVIETHASEINTDLKKHLRANGIKSPPNLIDGKRYLGYMAQTRPFEPPEDKEKLDITPNTYLDLRNAMLTKTDQNGQAIEYSQLPRVYFSILEKLLKRPSQHFSKSQLISGQQNEEAVLHTYISKIKKQAESLGIPRDFIQPVRSIGYKFVPPQKTTKAKSAPHIETLKPSKLTP